MCVIVVKARAISKNQIAFDFLEAKRASSYRSRSRPIRRCPEVILGPKAPRVEMRVFQFVIPFHRGRRARYSAEPARSIRPPHRQFPPARRVMPYSVSNPKTRFITSCFFSDVTRPIYERRSTSTVRRWAICPSQLRSRRRLRALARRDRSDRRNLDHVFRIVIDQLEPILGNIGGRENIVLACTRR